jgi:hypothetical protein
MSSIIAHLTWWRVAAALLGILIKAKLDDKLTTARGVDSMNYYYLIAIYMMKPLQSDLKGVCTGFVTHVFLEKMQKDFNSVFKQTLFF